MLGDLLLVWLLLLQPAEILSIQLCEPEAVSVGERALQISDQHPNRCSASLGSLASAKAVQYPLRIRSCGAGSLGSLAMRLRGARRAQQSFDGFLQAGAER